MEDGINAAVAAMLNNDLVTLVLAVIMGLVIKDIATNYAMGLLFKFNPDFNVGDKVFIDGNKAVIINIGTRQSIFEIEEQCTENGEAVVCWRYVYNDKIKSLNISKVKGV